MTLLPFVLIWLVIYLFSASVSNGIVVLVTRKRVNWRIWEFVFSFLPLVVWISLVAFNSKGKTLSNAVVEPFVCGILSSLQALTCSIFAVMQQKRGVFPLVFGVILGCISAVLVFLFMPALPE